MTEVKILVCGDVMGNFRTLFSKIGVINKKHGPFESMYCVGNFFGSNTTEYEELKSGKINVPIVTYILNGNEINFKDLYEPLEKSVPKIVYLGKMGCLTGTSGLKIAYLSGAELLDSVSDHHSAAADTFNNYNINISKNLITSMINTVGSGIDILLTSQWPKDVTKYALSLDKENEFKVNNCSSYLISLLAKILKPRYHFCGLSGMYYERVPYRNHADLLEKPVNVTRFIGLAPVNNPKKEKWMYAFNITPACSLNSHQLAENSGPATVCPYELSENIESDNDDRNQFFYATSNSGASTSKKRPRENIHEKQAKKPAIDASTCWFCLANTNVEKQLIITIGNHCYITLAKGVLVPEHVFIVPINHIASSVELSTEAFEELENFKMALANYFHDKDKDVVFFERNYRSPHLQIQVVPVPKQLKSQIEDKLYSCASNFEVTPLPSLSSIHQVVSQKSGQYFYFEFMINKKADGKYLALIDKSVKDFPLQIGRYILADVLDLQDRVNWQKCVNSVEEKKMSERMRQNFKRYDFTEQ